MYVNKAYGIQRKEINKLYKIIDTGEYNCYLAFDSILIDVGVPYVKIEPHIKDIKAIVMTHRHSDHLVPSTLGRILKLRPSVYVYVGPWFVPILQDLEEKEIIPKGRYKVIHPGYEYSIGAFNIMPIAVLHNVPNVAYFIHDTKSDLVLFHATDLSDYEGFSAMGADIVAIEFNHDETMMDELIQQDLLRIGFSHYVESRFNHSSFQKARDFVNTKTKGEENITLFKLHTSNFFRKYLDDA